jgi:NAD(P)H-flavin reductase/ferredoxin
MANLISAQRVTTARINDKSITIDPKETLLDAALRQGVDFPNSCRVGGCGSCKCKLTQGKVKELTETGYLLSGEELEAGYILACQSVPQSDVSIEVDLSQAGKRGVSGRVTGQDHVTHDITRLTVQLDQPLSYHAGQFANLSLDGVPGVVRSYSFATPARRDAVVSFYVRKVPGGQLSTRIHDEDLLGHTLHVDGPHGDFWMRPGTEPLLCVAGGSGLPPILAMLQAALAAGVSRPVTLLFGAREAQDLYALDEIEAIARAWPAKFRFIPVLSNADADLTWQGERGLVTEKIAALLTPETHGYLCGPPAMIDGAIALLREHGVAREHIHYDRFTTQADAAAAASGKRTETDEQAPEATFADYAKYGAFHLIGLLAAAASLLGGLWVIYGLLALVALYMVGDAALGDDDATPKFKHPKILTVQCWLALPLLMLIVFSGMWAVSDGDPLGFGTWLQSWSTYDVFAARVRTQDHLVALFMIEALMIGMVGTITAHELTHRTWDPVSMLVGRWLLAFSFDTNFAIEHVYGHHRYVSTVEDPATAPRGRNVYFHILASTLKGNISAWKIETSRLRKKHLAVLGFRNTVIRGQLMSLALLGAACAMGGLRCALFFTACGLGGKALLEIVNYMEHYGMVRNPLTPVQPRHSWNTNRCVSSWTMFNLTRHSHHHAQGEVPFHELKPYPEAPMMINGYLTTILVAMIPPLWHHLMTPKVLAWDRDYATAEELKLAAQANEKSGIPHFASHSVAS